MPVYTFPKDIPLFIRDQKKRGINREDIGDSVRDIERLFRRTDPETSKIAARNLVKSGAHASQCDKVYTVLKRFKKNGATPNEISERCDLDHYAVYKRLNDLKLRGLAFKTIVTRQNQTVWKPDC